MFVKQLSTKLNLTKMKKEKLAQVIVLSIILVLSTLLINHVITNNITF